MTTRPGGRLVLVGTPIGNLGDLSPRASEMLGSADTLCCEDTRRTRALLSARGIPAGNRLLSLHEHNEIERIPTVLDRLARGQVVAVVSDAGMPAISDPGAQLVAAAIGGGFEVEVVPGPSAVLGALVVSGLPTERFCVEGFLPRKGAARRARIDALRDERRTAVVLEAPTRLASTLGDLVTVLGERQIAVVRELTKLHEEVWRGSLSEAAQHFAVEPPRGEVVVVMGGAAPPAAPGDEEVAAAVSARLAQGESPSRAAESVASALGVPKRQAYEAALALRSSPG